MAKRRREKKNLLLDIILVVALVVFAFSAYQLWGIFSEYQKGSHEYKEIEQGVVAIMEREETGETEEPESDPLEKHQMLQIDFAALKEMNSDVVGWISFDEPSQINYPVVAGIDNAKYLHTTFTGKSNSAGTLFVDAQNSNDFTDRNTFIYGHNMKNGSMFGQLRKYKTSEFCRENPYFYIYTPDGKESTYQIFAVCIVKDVSESYNKWYQDDTEFLKYVEHEKGVALYSTDVEVPADGSVVSLSTCTNVTEDERLLVHGVKISEQMVGE